MHHVWENFLREVTPLTRAMSGIGLTNGGVILYGELG